ncbi:MAG: hypothetical protein CFE26_26395, partial [Verrucomicrobiales bacterium VVV1]
IAFRVPPPTATWKDGKARLIAPFPGADMRYTTDGSKPTAESTRYTADIAIEDPSKLRYVTLFQQRTSPAKNGAEREGFAKWTPQTVTADWKSTDFDATSAVVGDGIHRANFQYNSGAKKLMIRKVELVRDGKVIATDSHEGETGSRSIRNSYRLPVEGHRSGAKYILRAEIKADGGNDSQGAISLERSSWLEPVVKVDTSIPHYQDHDTKALESWNPGAFFWSSRPLSKDETLTFTFEKPLALHHVELPTGEVSGTKDQIQNAVLEASFDGKSFAKIADFAYGSAKAELNGKSVVAIRLRATGPHPSWCIVRPPQLR